MLQDIAAGPSQRSVLVLSILQVDIADNPKTRIQDPEISWAILAMFQCFDQHNNLYIG